MDRFWVSILFYYWFMTKYVFMYFYIYISDATFLHISTGGKQAAYRGWKYILNCLASYFYTKPSKQQHPILPSFPIL